MNKLFLMHDQHTRGMRAALGWASPTSSLLPQDLAMDSNQEPSIQPATWEKICSLFMTYRFLDVCDKSGSFGVPSPPKDLKPNELNEEIANKLKASSDLTH